MTQKIIEAKIMAFLKQKNPKETKELQLQTDLFEAGILDSFGVLEFIAGLEKEFHISVPNDDLVPQNLWNVQSAAKMVQKHLK